MIEIHEYNGEGYLPLVDFEGWRVAILRHNYEFASLTRIERHLETDEVFVLLSGNATLITKKSAESDATEELEMEQGKVYNVPKGVWHHIVVTPDANVLIVENSNTCDENSEIIQFDSVGG